ncbi:hypothetical protein ACQKQA_26555 [Pseudomonas sp. NPDC089530]|uniref:hypothetical protein n=1 Tax=Pseudomonas sp. NPDC089530 TaxID=3390651 RepID=UPI003D03EB54
MYQKPAQHPLSETVTFIDEQVFSAMWELFVHIGKYWKNMEDPSPFRSQLYSFMLNRIKLRPLYSEYYSSAMKVMSSLIEELGEDEAYAFLFTDPDAAKVPPETAIALTRQAVANEFMALQLSLGGFKAFGALNYCGYIGGANIPGQPAPYRTFED